MFQALLDFLRTLTNPERLIHLISTVLTGWLGYGLLFGVIFAETGLLTGFFLPGDSLLFTVGVVVGAGKLNLLAVNLVLMAAVLLGDTTGYLIGRRTGDAGLQPAGLALLQEGVRAAHASVLLQVRRQDHDLRQVRPHRAHLRPLHGGRGKDELPGGFSPMTCSAPSDG